MHYNSNSDYGWKSLAIVGILFFVIGFFTWLNGPLITFVKVGFSLNDINAFLIPMVFYISYLAFALPSSWVLKRTGLKNGLSIALIVMAVGALIFGQFIHLRWYPGILFGLFIIGMGLSCLQTAVNPYVSILGPIEKGAQRIALMGICNKIAGACAPILFGLVVTNIGVIEENTKNAVTLEAKEQILHAFTHTVYYPYIGMAFILLCVAYGIYRSKLPEINNDGDDNETTEKRGLPTSPRLWFGVFCIFVYVGVEVLAGDAIGTYGSDFHLPIDQTKYFTTFTLIAMLAGYISGIIMIPKIISQELYLILSTILGIALAIAAWCTTGYTSVLCVALLGFANSMMWPAIFPIAIHGLGKQTVSGSALMIMGICGGAIIPQFFVHLKEIFHFQTVFTGLAIFCYGCIMLFGIYGHMILKKDPILKKE